MNVTLTGHKSVVRFLRVYFRITGHAYLLDISRWQFNYLSLAVSDIDEQKVKKIVDDEIIRVQEAMDKFEKLIKETKVVYSSYCHFSYIRTTLPG